MYCSKCGWVIAREVFATHHVAQDELPGLFVFPVKSLTV